MKRITFIGIVSVVMLGLLVSGCKYESNKVERAVVSPSAPLVPGGDAVAPCVLPDTVPATVTPVKPTACVSGSGCSADYQMGASSPPFRSVAWGFTGAAESQSSKFSGVAVWPFTVFSVSHAWSVWVCTDSEGLCCKPHGGEVRFNGAG